MAVLPALLILFMSYHFWKVRKDGGISQPVTKTTDDSRPKQRIKQLTTIPHLVQKEFVTAAVLIVVLALWGMSIPAL